MDKSSVIKAMDSAKNAHLEQMQRLEFVIKGTENDHPISVSKKQCDFGKWLYNVDDNFKANVLGVQFFDQLDTEHEAWHEEYAKIYNILFKKKKSGFLAKVFHKDTIDTLELDKAKAYYAELKKISERLLNILEKSRRRIVATSESKFS